MSTSVETEVVDLLHCLGFIYLRHGQPFRAVVLLIVAAQTDGDRVDVLRTLCAALVAAKMGTQAIEVLTRLTHLAPGADELPMMRLLRARALLLVGREAEAVAVFRAA